MRRGVGSSGLLVLLLALAGGCGEELSPSDRVLLERQKFEVEILSWAPLPDGQIALDLKVAVKGKSDLDQLTVEVRQVDDEENVLRAEPVTLDVAGMGWDDARAVTVRVAGAGPQVRAVAVFRENVPDESKRGSYPEFAAGS